MLAALYDGAYLKLTHLSQQSRIIYIILHKRINTNSLKNLLVQCLKLVLYVLILLPSSPRVFLSHVSKKVRQKLYYLLWLQKSSYIVYGLCTNTHTCPFKN